MPKTLKRFVETYRGSSFPTRCETDDGETAVLKMHGAGNGAESMISEFMVNRLAALAGLPVPDAFAVDIPTGFPWGFGTDEFYDLVVKSAGPNLGLTWIEGGKPLAVSEYNTLPHDLVSKVVTLDLTFSNWDRTAYSNNLLRDRHGKVWIVDHGSCRAFFQKTGPRATTLPSDHIFAGWEDAYDPRWLERISSPARASVLETLPVAWLTTTNLTRVTLSDLLTARLP